jgi:methylase of polypeptide subunit release factors
MLIEHGAGQQDAVLDVLQQNGWTAIGCHEDFAGLPRVSVARRR